MGIYWGRNLDHAWEPTPPRPGSLDDANARGFDTDSILHDRVTPEPLSEHTAENDALVAEVERARVLLNETLWWQFVKRQDAADRYKRALLRGALWEIDHGVIPPVAGQS